MNVYSVMKDKGISLPALPICGGNYSLCKQAGQFLFTSGQTPKRDGVLIKKGRVGREVSEDEAYDMARCCTLNALAILENAIGDLNKIEQIVKITVFISSTEDFFNQAKVANGATDLLVELFGNEAGKPARSAVGMYALPGNAPCEVELQVKLKEF